MPRKNAMRDNVSAVRSRLPHLINAPREQIELALLYYESNVDETVEAFKRNGAIEALSGWTEMSNGRGNSSNKRSNNKSSNKSSSQTPPSNQVLRPSQRVSNIFQTFAEGGTPQTISNLPTDSLPSSIPYPESSNHNLESYPSTDLSFHPYLSQDSTTNNSNEYHDLSNFTNNSSTTTDEIHSLINHLEQDKAIVDEKPVRRRSIRERNGSITSNHEQTKTDEKIKTLTTPSNNRKVLSKSTKDLQRQTSTLTNVELSFENEIKSSLKRIDDVFKQLRDILKEREVELYLEMDKVKEQGLNIIHRRQHRALELRQRVNACDRLEPSELDNLRTDIKQFVTGGRYELGEELTSSHRFEYDQNLVESLKNFGTVLRIDRKDERSRTLSTSSALAEPNSLSPSSIQTTEKSTDHLQTSVTNGRGSLIEPSPPNHQQQRQQQQQKPLPQKISNKQNFNGNHAGDYHTSTQTNGYHHHYYDDSYNYQTMNRRRTPQQRQQQQQHNGNSRRTRQNPSSDPRHNGFNNSETTNTYRRPRPSPQPVVPPLSN